MTQDNQLTVEEDIKFLLLNTRMRQSELARTYNISTAVVKYLSGGRKRRENREDKIGIPFEHRVRVCNKHLIGLLRLCIERDTYRDTERGYEVKRLVEVFGLKPRYIYAQIAWIRKGIKY